MATHKEGGALNYTLTMQPGETHVLAVHTQTQRALPTSGCFQSPTWKWPCMVPSKRALQRSVMSDSRCWWRAGSLKRPVVHNLTTAKGEEGK